MGRARFDQDHRADAAFTLLGALGLLLLYLARRPLTVLDDNRPEI